MENCITPVAEDDDFQTGISPRKLMFLLETRFLDVLLVDLQGSISHQPPATDINSTTAPASVPPILHGASTEILVNAHNQHSRQQRILGSYVLKKLSHELRTAPNRGSAVYAVVGNSTLRNLFTLGCRWLVMYDEDGSRRNVARVFVDLMADVTKVTGTKRFGGLESIRYLHGGISAFRSQVPHMCVPLTVVEDAQMKTTDSSQSPEPRLSIGITSENFTPPHQTQNDPPCLIIPGIYLGGIDSTREEYVKTLKIHRIISVGETPLCKPPSTASQTFSYTNAASSIHLGTLGIQRPSDSPNEGEKIMSTSEEYLAQMNQTPTNSNASPLPQSTNKTSDTSFPITAPPHPNEESNYPPSKVSADMDSVHDMQITSTSAEFFEIKIKSPKSADLNDHRTEFHYFEIDDTAHAPIHKLFHQTNQIIQEAQDMNETVLVHCFGGVSRSSTIVIAYLMIKKELSLVDAFAHVFRARPWICPNDGFWEQLQMIERDQSVQSFHDKVYSEFWKDNTDLRTSPDGPLTTITSKVMKNLKLERVEEWWKIKDACQILQPINK